MSDSPISPMPPPLPSLAPDLPLYVYGFGLRPPTVWPDGIAGPVGWVAGTALGAIAEGGIDLGALQSQEDTLLQAVVIHDQVLQQVFAQGPVLPLRFGTVFPYRAALEAYLAHGGDSHRVQLLALGDRAEYQVSATPISPEPEPPLAVTSGRAYFLAKKARLQAEAERQRQQQAQWQQVTAALGEQFPWVLGNPEEMPRRLYVLAPRSGQELDQQLLALQSQASLWHFQRSQPLPPYHFPDMPLGPVSPVSPTTP